MSHVMALENLVAPFTEWYFRLTNEYNELRVGVTDVIKQKMLQFFTMSWDWVTTYHLELLCFVLSSFLLVAYLRVLDRAMSSEKALQARAEYMSFLEDSRLEVMTNRDELEHANTELIGDIQTLREELESAKYDLDYRVSELEEERDSIQAMLDDCEYDRHTAEMDRDEAKEELEQLKNSVPQLAYV